MPPGELRRWETASWVSTQTTGRPGCLGILSDRVLPGEGVIDLAVLLSALHGSGTGESLMGPRDRGT